MSALYIPSHKISSSIVCFSVPVAALMGNGCISRLPDYVVFVKTGDKKGAGTDANVSLSRILQYLYTVNHLNMA